MVAEIPERAINSAQIASAMPIPDLSDPLPEGFAQDLYMRARRLASAAPKDGAPNGSVNLGRDDAARQIVVTLRLPFQIRDDFKLGTSYFEIADYAE